MSAVVRLEALVADGARRAEATGEPVLVSVTVSTPAISPVEAFAACTEPERFLWDQPHRGSSIVGLGVAARVNGRGANRFHEVKSGWERLRATALVDSDPILPLAPPVAVGGFAFDPARSSNGQWRDFPDAELAVPRVAVIVRGQDTYLSVSVVVAPGDGPATGVEEVANTIRELPSAPAAGNIPLPPAPARIGAGINGHSHWAASVISATDAIRAGTLRKVVLAREIPIRCGPGVGPALALSRLRERFPRCTMFAAARGDACFLGATPENLVRLSGRELETGCVAGSRRRGATPDADAAEGAALLVDPKERHEHAVVVEALRARLGPLCSELRVAAGPELLKVANVQHLNTPISATVRDDLGLLDLVERLHPTPATGGHPVPGALAFIRGVERFDRGWYAGAMWWMDRAGAGEAAVAIRSALVRGEDALLYAGCGIVADSEPERELAESCLKLEPMMWALA